MPKLGRLLFLFFTFITPTSFATEYGPEKGALVIVGGGFMDGTGIPERFLELAGGPGAKLVAVLTARGNHNKDGTIKVHDPTNFRLYWEQFGFEVQTLHTHDRTVADTESFVKPLQEADAVWFYGGRQWNLVDSYAGTRTQKEFERVLERGGVIGGSSAGASIQGDYLVRGDTKTSRIMMTEEVEHQKGFAYLRRSAIDQHIDAFDRWDDLIPVVERYPDLLGIGLSEGTAIVVQRDEFEVIGKWKVAVHDNARAYLPWEKPYFVLARGDVFDMRLRKIIHRGTGLLRDCRKYPHAIPPHPSCEEENALRGSPRAAD